MKVMIPPHVQVGLAVNEVTAACFALAAGASGLGDPVHVARAKGMTSNVVALLEKAPVGPTLVPSKVQTQAFLASAAAYGVFDRMVNDGATKTLPLDTPVGMITSGFTAKPHAPGGWIGLSSLTVENGLLALRETAAIVAATKELMNAVGTEAEGLFSRELKSACAKAVDAVFVDELVAAAGAGGSAAGLPAAIANVLGALETTSESRVYLLVPPTIARTAAGAVGGSGMLYPLMSVGGGQIGQLPTLVTDELPDDEIMAVDASQIAANAGTVEFDVGRSADLKMDSAPTAGAGTLVSMFQTNSVGLRAVRAYGFELLSATCAARCTITA